MSSSKDILPIYNSICSSSYLPRIDQGDLTEFLNDFESYKIISWGAKKKTGITPSKTPTKFSEFSINIAKEEIKLILKKFDFFKKYFIEELQKLK